VSTHDKSAASTGAAKASDGVRRAPRGIAVRLARAPRDMHEGGVGPAQPRRVTIRLTPYEARLLWRLRTAGLPDGVRPRTATDVLVHALVRAAATLVEPDGPREPPTPPADGADARKV
jgi:hypothetical protein